VGMGPQEHAFRNGVDVIIATPGRLLDHFKQPYAKLAGLEVLVLDEADRMLDMGFLPDIKRVLKHLPTKRQTLFFSATMPAPIVALTRELLHNPATINLERKSVPAIGIRQAVYAVREELKPARSIAPTGSPIISRLKASRTRRFTGTARRPSAQRRSTAFATVATSASSPRISWRAVSMSSNSSTS
jgi:superfamily II DNA/RNA helicase